MNITAKKTANAKALAWAIRKATGINCGGYKETGGVAQTGSVGWRSDVGILVEVPDDTAPAVVAQIQAIVDTHNPNLPLAPDYPPSVSPVVVVPWVEAYEKAATVDARLKVLFDLAKNGAAWFVEPELPKL